jgi:hypothetical protein
LGRILLYLSLALLAAPWALAAEKSGAELSSQIAPAWCSGKIAEAQLAIVNSPLPSGIK